MSDRPTLPGIANLLALAGQHRSALLPSPPPSHSHGPRPSQLSDLIAHTFPAFVDLPQFPKIPPLSNRPAREPPSPPRHQIQRRRTSRTTNLVHPDKKPSSTYSPHPLHQHQIIPTPSLDIVNHTPPSLNRLDDPPPRRLSEHTSTPPTYDCNRRWDPQETSSHHHNINPRTSCHQSFESRSQISVSPTIIPSPRLSGGPSSIGSTASPRLSGGPSSIGSTASCPQNHRYQCLEVGCGKTFSRPSSLKIHSYSHTGQKPFKCMRCDRAFSVQSNLKRHQKVHEKRSIAVYSRGIPGNNSTISPNHMMPYESGSGLLIEEQSGEDDEGHDRMED